MISKSVFPRSTIYFFVMPALLLYSLIIALPVLQSIRMSFYQWDGLTTPIFSGLSNYRTLFNDSEFPIALRNGLIFAFVLIVYQIGLGSFFAFFLAHHNVKGSKFVRDALFIPVVLSVSVVAQLWLSLYNPEYGLINRIMADLGVGYRQNWLGQPSSAIWSIAFVNAWQFMGYHLILLYTAVRAIPETYYEAATIEGASTLRKTWSITLPLMSETYRFCLIIALTAGFRAFEHMNIMTGGGPGTATYTLTYIMFRSAFRMGNFGLSSASVAILVLQCLVATWVINKIFESKSVEY